MNIQIYIGCSKKVSWKTFICPRAALTWVLTWGWLSTFSYFKVIFQFQVTKSRQSPSSQLSTWVDKCHKKSTGIRLNIFHFKWNQGKLEKIKLVGIVWILLANQQRSQSGPKFVDFGWIGYAALLSTHLISYNQCVYILRKCLKDWSISSIYTNHTIYRYI